MDSLTQAVLGAGIQGALLGRYQGRKAFLYGGLLATLPDMDVLISYPDPVSLMTYHRGFSHSLFVLTGLAVALTWLIRRKWPHAQYSTRRLFLTLSLVLVTHTLLDAFTVYGTQLFWPWPSIPESWAALFIIDPVYTVPLLVAVVAAAKSGYTPKSQRGLVAALVFSTAYLGVAMLGHWQAKQRVEQALLQRGVQPIAIQSTPMPFNSLLWRVLAKDEHGQYYESISGWLDQHPPEMVALPLHLNLRDSLEGVPLHDRLRWFTGDWLRYDAIDNLLVVSDLRMGIAGYYTFRFVMAERGADGHWQSVTPRHWHGERGGWTQLKRVMGRIFDSSTPLPLEEWAVYAMQPQVLPRQE